MTFNVEDTVWFIDNTAPGSLNLGTQDNPFTSIAAFNAVNDGVGNHPAAGDIVYLRAGTYTEADGINLLNNQTLIGQGENLIVNHSRAATHASSRLSGPDAGHHRDRREQPRAFSSRRATPSAVSTSA